MPAEVTIEYCTAWNYEPHAVGLAEKLLRLKQGLRSLTLIPSDGGAFEVTVNGHKIHSKLATGQFPEPDAILKAVRAKR